MKRKKHYLIIGIFCASLILQGCGESGSSGKEAALLNQADKPIMLKELTTGIPYDTKKFPKPNFKFQEVRHFKYKYFGELRDVKIKVTSKNIIYDIEIRLDINAEQLLNELEGKLSAENAKPIKFDCAVSSVSLEPLGIMNSKLESRECKVIGNTQELILKLQKPTGTAAITRLDLEGGSIRLTDIVIEKSIREEKRQKNEESYKSDEKKRKSDI